jgi:hypothetical protein
MHIPLGVVVSTLYTKPGDFNLIHFKDAAHDMDAPAHFWVTISAGRNWHVLLSMVTTQMSKLEKIYRRDDDNGEKALDSLALMFCRK